MLCERLCPSAAGDAFMSIDDGCAQDWSFTCLQDLIEEEVQSMASVAALLEGQRPHQQLLVGIIMQHSLNVHQRCKPAWVSCHCLTSYTAIRETLQEYIFCNLANHVWQATKCVLQQAHDCQDNHLGRAPVCSTRIYVCEDYSVLQELCAGNN